MRKLLIVFFTIIYFIVFCFLIDLIFRNTLSTLANVLAIFCWLIALAISGGLADFTVKKIKDKLTDEK